MTTPNLAVCPHCGRKDFPLAARERLEAEAVITLDTDPENGASASWDGHTEIDWDSSRTLCYLCQECQGTLPEEYAAALDALLGNTRLGAP